MRPFAAEGRKMAVDESWITLPQLGVGKAMRFFFARLRIAKDDIRGRHELLNQGAALHRRRISNDALLAAIPHGKSRSSSRFIALRRFNFDDLGSLLG